MKLDLSQEMKNKSKTRLLTLVILCLPLISNAQCAMCRAVLQNETSQNAAEGINNGIVYLMVFPYLLVGGVGYFVYRSRRKHKSD